MSFSCSVGRKELSVTSRRTCQSNIAPVTFAEIVYFGSFLLCMGNFVMRNNLASHPNFCLRDSMHMIVPIEASREYLLKF